MVRFKDLKIPKVIGHRGACGYAPENTLASMRKAAELGVAWVEFDVMLTHDEQPIIIHDDTLDRTTNGHGHVAKHNWEKISQLDAGSWFAPEYAHEKIPSLMQLLIYLQKLSLHINVEIKPTHGRETLTAEKTLEVLLQYWPREQSLPLVSSFFEASLQQLRLLNQEIPLAYNTDHWLADWQGKLIQFDCVSLHINHLALDAEKAAQIKQAGYGLLAYTVNDPQRAQQLFNWGVDAVFSDVPDKIL